jgi:hypothetical protein
MKHAILTVHDVTDLEWLLGGVDGEVAVLGSIVPVPATLK